MRPTSHCNGLDECVEKILEACGEHVVLALPLGLGKPNRLVNALYRRVAADPSRRLTIHTALSLTLPKPSSELERRFAEPFLKRQFGEDYPDLIYAAAMRADALPSNIRVHEFYFQSGSMLGSRQAQRDYIGLNYTFVARDLVGAGINVVAQLIARRETAGQAHYSLGCNPDVTLDLIDGMRDAGVSRPMMIGVVHDQLPFLGGDADVGDGEDLFDIVLSTPRQGQRLFALPREDVDDAEYAIGLHASTLVKDGGTLQIGIGALSDALVQALIIRQHRNHEYRETLTQLRHGSSPALATDGVGGLDGLIQGLYGSSEMIMDGFMHLRRQGILTRRVYPDLAVQKALDKGTIEPVLKTGDAQRLREAGVLPSRLDETGIARLIALGIFSDDAVLRNHEIEFSDGKRIVNDLDRADALESLDQRIRGRSVRGGCYLQGGFCLGSAGFYEWLASLDGDDFDGLAMNRISEVNQLRRGEETLAALQHREARFFNTCMIATALGAAASDAIEDGRIVSGVGGQYNFVAMSYALEDARSILMLRSTRNANGEITSNIRWSYGHATIPRHLRDIYVSEYGIADLRGKTDEECVLAMIAISDARFQKSLVDSAIRALKLPQDFQIPHAWTDNTPAVLHLRLKAARSGRLLPDYPFGSDFNDVELRLLRALGWLKSAAAARSRWLELLGAVLNPGTVDREAMERMGLAKPHSLKQRMLARLVIAALNRCG